MAYCTNCGSDIDNRAVSCPECGHQTSVNNQEYLIETRGSRWFFVLGFCIPVVGLVLFFVWLKDKPRSATSALVGSLVNFVVTFILIIVAFAMPAVGQIVSNTEQDVILADALAVENAARLYCIQNTCSDGEELTWDDLSSYIDGIDEEWYDFNNNGGIIAMYNQEGVRVYMERTGIGDYELIWDTTPSECDRSCVIIDNN